MSTFDFLRFILFQLRQFLWNVLFQLLHPCIGSLNLFYIFIRFMFKVVNRFISRFFAKVLLKEFLILDFKFFSCFYGCSSNIDIQKPLTSEFICITSRTHASKSELSAFLRICTTFYSWIIRSPSWIFLLISTFLAITAWLIWW